MKALEMVGLTDKDIQRVLKAIDEAEFPGIPGKTPSVRDEHRAVALTAMRALVAHLDKYSSRRWVDGRRWMQTIPADIWDDIKSALEEGI